MKKQILIATAALALVACGSTQQPELQHKESSTMRSKHESVVQRIDFKWYTASDLLKALDSDEKIRQHFGNDPELRQQLQKEANQVSTQGTSVPLPWGGTCNVYYDHYAEGPTDVVIGWAEVDCSMPYYDGQLYQHLYEEYQPSNTDSWIHRFTYDWQSTLERAIDYPDFLPSPVCQYVSLSVKYNGMTGFGYSNPENCHVD